MNRWLGHEHEFWDTWLALVDEPRDRQIIEFFRHNQHHILPLKRIEEESVYCDRYGDWHWEEWEHEVDEFVKLKLPKLPPASKAWADTPSQTVAAVLDRIWHELGIEVAAISEVDDGRSFEQQCARLLAARGFQVSVTGRSGDQGADLIAERAGIRVAVQCKRHSEPVGNAAVQQVAAARTFHKCQRAIVVSLKGFTNSAQVLSAALNVELLLMSDLREYSL